MSVIRFPRRLRLVKPEQNQVDTSNLVKTCKAIDLANMRRELTEMSKEIKLTKAKLRLRIVSNDKEGNDK